MKLKTFLVKASCLIFTGSALYYAKAFGDNPEQSQPFLVLTSVVALTLWTEWDKLEKKVKSIEEEPNGNNGA